MSGRFLTRLGNGLFGNATAQASALLVQLVVALVSVPVFATVWGLEDYGVWLILVTVPATIALSDLGFIGAVGNAMTAAVARGQDAGAREMFGQLTALAFWVGLGLLSFLWIRDPHWLLLSLVGVGFAWASILSLPYALLSDSLPAAKMGVYMGLFNFFIVIPQLVAASLLGLMLRTFMGDAPINALAVGGASLLLAGLFTLRVRIATPVVPVPGVAR